ncbi:hypothetical protein DPEC_G00108870 [Dallia pectoralis]|uniref:Uncharacterized protein n=1 Tax=Dallia pectoralis TaxID=75939 RepID=A0ACC2GSF9_DALPE|nr:hypothetical protein DPEC_G00108870 [Dallia pectoralis]
MLCLQSYSKFNAVNEQNAQLGKPSVRTSSQPRVRTPDQASEEPPGLLAALPALSTHWPHGGDAQKRSLDPGAHWEVRPHPGRLSQGVQKPRKKAQSQQISFLKLWSHTGTVQRVHSHLWGVSRRAGEQINQSLLPEHHGPENLDRLEPVPKPPRDDSDKNVPP